MKNLLLCLSLFLTFHVSKGQDSIPTDATSISLDVQIEKSISDPYYLLLIEEGANIELSKSEVQRIREKWISKVEIWTDKKKKKEYGYDGIKPLVNITLKKKRLTPYLELIGKNIETKPNSIK